MMSHAKDRISKRLYGTPNIYLSFVMSVSCVRPPAVNNCLKGRP